MIKEQEEVVECKAIIEYIIKRIRMRNSCNIIHTGNLGSGKSYQGLRLLELWYELAFEEEFPIENVCSTLEEAILKVKDFKRPGEGILVEEISVLASSRDSLTKTNKLFNKFMDTARIKQALIILNAPHYSYIDKHIISLCNIWLESLGVDFKKEIGFLKGLKIQTSQYKVEPYRHKFINEEGWAIDYFTLRKPSERLCVAYDKLKNKSVNDLYEELALEMRIERKKKLKALGKKELAPREKEAYDYRLEGMKLKDIAVEMGISIQAVGNYLKNAKEKILLNA